MGFNYLVLIIVFFTTIFEGGCLAGCRCIFGAMRFI